MQAVPNYATKDRKSPLPHCLVAPLIRLSYNPSPRLVYLSSSEVYLKENIHVSCKRFYFEGKLFLNSFL
jgi:hypothetical protein